jgi:hypothetical protein
MGTEELTPLSQGPVTGTGTAADPLVTTTVVGAGATGLLIAETLAFVTGEPRFRSTAVIINAGTASQSGQLFQSGSCRLAGSPFAYGLPGPAPACAASPAEPTPKLQLVPVTAGSTHFKGDSWTQPYEEFMRRGLPFDDTCACGTNGDASLGLAWPYALAPGESASFVWDQILSGPPALSAAAGSGSSRPGEENSYRIAITDHEGQGATIDSLTVTLPPGFTYLPGRTTGVTTADPTISGRQLTWAGPFVVPAFAHEQLEIAVTVASAPGAYTIDVAATAGVLAVAPATGVAPITVAYLADLGVTLAADPTQVPVGGATTVTATATNAGPDTVDARVVVTQGAPGGVLAPGDVPAGCTNENDVLSCLLRGLAPGSSSAVVLPYTIDASAGPGEWRFQAGVMPVEGHDPWRGNNRAGLTVEVLREARLDLAMTPRPTRRRPATP